MLQALLNLSRRGPIMVRLVLIFSVFATFLLPIPGTSETMSPAQLRSALATARGGERIELPGGDYGRLTLSRRFAEDVTIASADPHNPAIFHTLTIENSRHVVLDGIRFDYVARRGAEVYDRPFQVIASSHITIRNSVFDGDEVPATEREGTYGTGKALTVRNCDTVVVESNEFFKFWKAIIVSESARVVLRRNDIHTIRSDGLNFQTVDGLLIEENHIHDFKMLPAGGDHRDMIQWWSLQPDQYIRNVTITGNFLDAGRGAITQSIFSRDVPAEKGGDASVFFRNIRITDNVIYNGHINGIVVGATEGLEIRNNTILHNREAVFGPGERGGTAPAVRLQAVSRDVTVERNVLHKDIQAAPGWNVRGNLVVRSTDYSSLLANPDAAEPDLDDLRALPDGIIRSQGLGARMTREEIVLSAGPTWK